MPLLGAHMSIAGGYHKAVEAAAALGMDCVQLFTKNNNQWKAAPLADDDAARFEAALERTGIRLPCAHDSYLINLASPQDELWERSIDAFVVELERADRLGLAGVVMHPGACTGSTEEEGLARVVEAFDRVLDRTAGGRTGIWVETTAGQGTTLGWRFEHLAAILDGVRDPSRFGVCLDTCHVFAAGYPLGTRAEYRATLDEFDRLVGLERLRACHLNDSLKPLGSRVDRHAHIGEGHLGLEPFRHLLNDPRLAELPMYLETNKGERDGRDLDAINLETLRSLIVPRSLRRKSPRT